MASRSTAPGLEKKLRTIYELLDNGNNKKALQDADRLLKKHPNSPNIKPLKCLALIRLGREEESMELLDILRKDGSLEESSLQLVTACYRELHKPSIICELYELANKQEPNNEDILINLFVSYVRVANYKKQVSTAMSLYKVNQKSQYYFWAILSLLIQTSDKISDLLPYFIPSTYYSKEYLNKPPPIENDKEGYLTLAYKMFMKHTEKKLGYQELLIYLVILEMQGRLQEAFDVVSGEMGKELEYSTATNKRIDLCIKMEQWAKVNILLKTALLEDMDAWHYVMLYLDSVLYLAKGQSYDLEDENCPIYEAKNFLEELAKQNKAAKFRKRGPYLAQLEFYSRLLTEGYVKEKLENIIFTCLEEYIKEFGTKEACLHDIRPYLQLVCPLKFLSHFCKYVSLKSNEFPKSKDQMNLHLTNLELYRIYGIHEMLPIPERVQSVKHLMQYFAYCLKFNEGLLPTEPRSSDRYALLAAHTLHELWVETENSNYLFEAIVLCHYALEYSPSNSQLKTLLVKFYHLIGGWEGANSGYTKLDLKHMQLDTLGYLHVFPLLTNAEYNSARSVLNQTLKFFGIIFKESGDHITYAYKYDALTKIPEFIHIKEKLSYSTHYKQVTVEKMLLDIFSSQNHGNTLQIIKEIIPVDIEWSQLQDNRDFTVLWDVDPDDRRLNDFVIKQTYLLDVVFLRLRSQLLHTIIASFQLCLSDSESFCETENNDMKSMLSTYSQVKTEIFNLTAQLEDHLTTLKNKSSNFISNKFIAGPPQSRLILFIQCNYFDPIVNQLKFMIYLLPGEHSNKEEANSHLEYIILFFKEFINVIWNESVHCDNPLTRNIVVQMAALFSEIASFSCIIAGICETVLKKFKPIVKKNKKKKDILGIGEIQSDFDWRPDVLRKFVNAGSSYFKYLEEILKCLANSWKDLNLKMGDISCVNELEDPNEMTLLKKMCQLTNNNLSASYINSMEQIITVLKNKIKYIGNHKV